MRHSPPKTERDLEIVKAVYAGESNSSVARRYGITQARVGRILFMHRWRNDPEFKREFLEHPKRRTQIRPVPKDDASRETNESPHR